MPAVPSLLLPSTIFSVVTSTEVFGAAPQSELTINWEKMPTYNTIMAVAAGAGLVVLVMLGRQLMASPSSISPEGYAIGLGVPGLILALTGLHMTLTWPLAPAFPFDNIVFGETALGFGVLLLASSLYSWRRGAQVLADPDPLERLIAVA